MTDAPFEPLPCIAIETVSIVFFEFTSVEIGSNIWPLASARCFRSPIACCTRGDVTSRAETTTFAGDCAPGKARWIDS